ncbi:MAG: serine/threonine protein kinase, partial [Ktedonobacteraceae bacterium]|nr:serine/threonine protein kinase [Ktedonobacteraceae bacterium]
MIRDDGLVNENFGGYRITTEIGSNAFNPTFLGESISPTASYRRVVIKLLYTVRVHTQEEQQEILRKISALQQLDHPHILPILSTGFHKDMPYIITEYQVSGSLYDRLQRQAAGQPIHPEEALLTFAQMGQALQYAHQKQIIHGYLKPQNVLFNKRNEALITGFHRHALLLADEPEDTASQEFSIYRAPEQLAGQTNEKSDQYVLGCLAYEMLTGHKAFIVPSVKTPGAYYKTRSLIAPRRLNSTLPLYIEEALLKAMSREPEQRYDDIATFLAALKIPLAAGNKELRETIATLAQIMKEAVPAALVVPSAEVDTRKSSGGHAPSEAPVAEDGNRTDADDSSPLAANIVGKDAPATPVYAALADVAGGENEITLEVQQPYGVSSATSLHKIRKSFASNPRRAFVVTLCMVAIMIVFTTTLIYLNFSLPTKKERTLPSIQGTSDVHSPTPTNMPVAAATRRSGSSPTPVTKVPSHKATPQPSTVPNVKPTSTPTTAPKPTPPQVLVALTSFFNNEGIGNAPGQADFDGSGYAYPADQVPGGGQISLQGVPYRFPANGSGTNDNIAASGQTIPLTPGNYRQAFLLA